MFCILYYFSLETQALSYGYKIDQGDYTDLMFFLPFKVVEEVSPNLDALSANTSSLYQHGKAEKTKTI